jgi:hypothetical protein
MMGHLLFIFPQRAFIGIDAPIHEARSSAFIPDGHEQCNLVQLDDHQSKCFVNLNEEAQNFTNT